MENYSDVVTDEELARIKELVPQDAFTDAEPVSLLGWEISDETIRAIEEIEANSRTALVRLRHFLTGDGP